MVAFSKFALPAGFALQTFAMFPNYGGRGHLPRVHEVALRTPDAWAQPAADPLARPGRQIFSEDDPENQPPEWFVCPVSAVPYTAGGPDQPVCTPDGQTLSASALWEWNKRQLAAGASPSLPNNPACVTHSSFRGGKECYVNRALIDAAESVAENRAAAQNAQAGLQNAEAREADVEARAARIVDETTRRNRDELRQREAEIDELRQREVVLRRDMDELRARRERESMNGLSPAEVFALQRESEELRAERLETLQTLHNREMEMNELRRQAQNAMVREQQSAAEVEHYRGQSDTAWGALSVVRDELQAAAAQHHHQLSRGRSELLEAQQQAHNTAHELQRQLRERERDLVGRDAELGQVRGQVRYLEAATEDARARDTEVRTLRSEVEQAMGSLVQTERQMRETHALMRQKNEIVENVTGALTGLEEKLASAEELGKETEKKLERSELSLADKTNLIGTLREELVEERRERMMVAKQVDRLENKENVEAQTLRGSLGLAEAKVSEERVGHLRTRTELHEAKHVEEKLRSEMADEQEKHLRRQREMEKRLAEMQKKLENSVPVITVSTASSTHQQRSRSTSGWRSGPPISPLDISSSPIPASSAHAPHSASSSSSSYQNGSSVTVPGRLAVTSKGRNFLQAAVQEPLAAPRGEHPRSPFEITNSYDSDTNEFSSVPSTRAPSILPSPSFSDATPGSSAPVSRSASRGAVSSESRSRSALRQASASSSRTQTPDEDNFVPIMTPGSSRPPSVERPSREQSDVFPKRRLNWTPDCASEERPLVDELACSTVFENIPKLEQPKTRTSTGSNAGRSSSTAGGSVRVPVSSASSSALRAAASGPQNAPRSFNPPPRPVRGSASVTNLRAPLRPVLQNSNSTPDARPLRPANTNPSAAGRPRASSTGGIVNNQNAQRSAQSSTSSTPETSAFMAPRRKSEGANGSPRKIWRQ